MFPVQIQLLRSLSRQYAALHRCLSVNVRTPENSTPEDLPHSLASLHLGATLFQNHDSVANVNHTASTKNRCFSKASAIHGTLSHEKSTSIFEKNVSNQVVEDCLQNGKPILLRDSPILAHIQASARPQNSEYKLPTVQNAFLPKKSILDPMSNRQSYELPTFNRKILEKFTPSMSIVVPIQDPNPLQRIIDQGAPPITKECMPYLMRIRHRKMKKHKLKKLRKRMIFLNRKLTAIKKAKKEKALRELENSYAQQGRDFDAEKWMEGRLEQAREGGWGLDPWKDYRSGHEARK